VVLVLIAPILVALAAGLIGISTPAVALAPAVRGAVIPAVLPVTLTPTEGAPTTPTTTPPTTTPAPVPTPPACPVGSMVVVVGDSITELGAAKLRASLTAAGYVPQINARGGRTIAAASEVVWGFGEEVGLQRCWVIALGTNDAFYSSPEHYQYDILRLLSFIPAGEKVWWVPVRVAGGDAINALVPISNPLVPATLTTWQPVAGDIQADGVHTTVQGQAHWAASIMAALG
jgi:hypothetical protein